MHGDNNWYLGLLLSILRIVRNTNNNIQSLILSLISIEIQAWNCLLLRIVMITNILAIKRKSLSRSVILIRIVSNNCWCISYLYITINCSARVYSFSTDATANDTHYDGTNNRDKSCNYLANIKAWINILVILINRNFIIIIIIVVEYKHVPSICLKCIWIVVVHWSEIFVVLVVILACWVVSHVSYQKIPLSFIPYKLFYSLYIYILYINFLFYYGFIVIYSC
jgi:hypothetical protein